MPETHSADLKIFLGFAPGVGKTYSMLDEAHRRARRGQEVVIGVIDDRGRADTRDAMDGLDRIPTLPTGEMDLEAILARKPNLVLVDDLHHRNAAGSRYERRWQEVEALRAAGVGVLTTLNVLHLESLNDLVKDITGHPVEDTVPDRLLHTAGEIELVDATPKALINRFDRGAIFPSGEAPSKIKDLFREGNLVALREIAMREAAGRVDEDLDEYRKSKNISKPWATSDRVMIAMAPNRGSLRLIRKGWRMGQRLRGKVVAVHVEEAGMDEAQRRILKDDLALAERLGIETISLKGEIAEALIKFAQEHNVTQLLMGHPERSRLQNLVRPSIVSEVARALRTVDITLVAAEPPSPGH
ncbi:sensor histidine kinase KdpD [bacterium]|nr:MAG: sensor histidine kinase KdpD [bacterium]